MSSADALPAPSATVLVVDDEALIQMATADMLQDLGYATIEVGSGREALDVLSSGAKVDFLITDHAMPGMTGIELVRAVRALRPTLPVLLVTGYAELPGDPAGGVPKLAKPYRQEELANRIAELMQLAGSDPHRSGMT